MSRCLIFASAACALLSAVIHADEFDSNGVKIHYLDQGKGDPVVLIHGLYSSAAINWKLPGIVAKLAETRRVIALDCRGHGDSGKPESEDEYGPQMAEDVLRLLDHLKIEKADVVGYSMGGMIALKFTAMHPERVRSTVLGGMGWLRAGGVLQKVWEHLGGRGDAKVPEACVQSLAQLAITESELAAVRVPVTMIVGDRDPVKRLYVDPASRLRPDWPVREIAGAGHLTCVAKPEFKDEVAVALERAAGKK